MLPPHQKESVQPIHIGCCQPCLMTELKLRKKPVESEPSCQDLQHLNDIDENQHMCRPFQHTKSIQKHQEGIKQIKIEHIDPQPVAEIPQGKVSCS